MNIPIFKYSTKNIIYPNTNGIYIFNNLENYKAYISKGCFRYIDDNMFGIMIKIK